MDGWKVQRKESNQLKRFHLHKETHEDMRTYEGAPSCYTFPSLRGKEHVISEWDS